MTVNMFVAGTGIYQLIRIARYHKLSDKRTEIYVGTGWNMIMITEIQHKFLLEQTVKYKTAFK